MKPSEFLSALWESNPFAPILVWTLPDKKSRWLTNPLDADIEWENHDVYTGVALPPLELELTPKQRFKSEQASAIAGLWADVDYQDDVHRNPDYPERNEALKVLMKDIEQPTILVHSGHGYQPWWLFEKPWIFKNDNDKTIAENLVRRWQHTLAIAMESGLDSVHDLARIMRLPGSRNHKGKTPVRVTGDYIGERKPLQWWLEQSQGWAPLPSKQGKKELGKVNFVLRKDAELDPAKLEALLDDVPGAKQAFEHKAKIPDKSPSGFDMALANYGAAAQLSDQEIVNLLIQARRRNLCDLLLTRYDKYQRTIQKARASSPLVNETSLDVIMAPQESADDIDVYNL